MGSIGWLLPTLKARLVDERDDGTVVDVPVGEPGEIWVKGANIMKVCRPPFSPDQASKQGPPFPGLSQQQASDQKFDNS